MSAISDKLKSTIQSIFDLPRDRIEKTVNAIIKNTRKGKSEGQQIKKVLKQIEDSEKKINQVESIINTVNSVLTSLDAAKKAAVATEKASTISASLNPASAAIAVAQKYVIEKVDQEIKESKDALNVAPKQIENYKGFTSETKEKLKKVESEQERKKQIKEERNIKLNS